MAEGWTDRVGKNTLGSVHAERRQVQSRPREAQSSGVCAFAQTALQANRQGRKQSSEQLRGKGLLPRWSFFSRGSRKLSSCFLASLALVSGEGMPGEATTVPCALGGVPGLTEAGTGRGSYFQVR